MEGGGGRVLTTLPLLHTGPGLHLYTLPILERKGMPGFGCAAYIATHTYLCLFLHTTTCLPLLYYIPPAWILCNSTGCHTTPPYLLWRESSCTGSLTYLEVLSLPAPIGSLFVLSCHSLYSHSLWEKKDRRRRYHCLVPGFCLPTFADISIRTRRKKRGKTPVYHYLCLSAIYLFCSPLHSGLPSSSPTGFYCSPIPLSSIFTYSPIPTEKTTVILTTSSTDMGLPRTYLPTCLPKEVAYLPLPPGSTGRFWFLSGRRRSSLPTSPPIQFSEKEDRRSLG